MTGFNPYAPPSAQTDGQATVLASATFLGSPLAGFIVMAMNERRLGRPGGMACFVVLIASVVARKLPRKLWLVGLASALLSGLSACERVAQPDDNAATITFTTNFSRGERSITLTRDGEVRVGEDKVGELTDGRAIVDGVEIGVLAADGSFTLQSLDASFSVSPDGALNLGKDEDYFRFADDGTMLGELVEETAGMRARYQGPADRRDELAFLFMAVTVARGPAIDQKAQPITP